jgi:hypothetical protein
MVDKATKILGHVDDRVVSCRGDHHPWPMLWQPGRVPKGTRYSPSQVQGVTFVHQDCPNCSRWREKLLAPGETWSYGGGLRDFSAEPLSERAELTRADYRNELYRRINESVA